MTVRTEYTLQRMWEESLTLRSQAAEVAEEMRQDIAAAEASERAAAAERAAAEAHHTAALAHQTVANGKANEAADLADIVNREREELGLASLTYGEPYEAPTETAALETAVDR